MSLGFHHALSHPVVLFVCVNVLDIGLIAAG